MIAPEDFTYNMPRRFEVDMAKSILKQKADFRKKVFGKFLKLVELQLQSGRECDLSMKQNNDGLTIEFVDMTELHRCHSFMLYDFNTSDQLNAGIKMIERFMKTGEPIMFYSMTDKRPQSDVRQARD